MSEETKIQSGRNVSLPGDQDHTPAALADFNSRKTGIEKEEAFSSEAD